MFYGAKYNVVHTNQHISQERLQQDAENSIRSYISNVINVTKHTTPYGTEYSADYFLMSKDTMYKRLRVLKQELDKEAFDKVMEILIKD